MSIITKIEAQKNNRERVNIYIDDNFFSGLDLELVYSLNLSKGKEINEKELKELIYKDNISKAKSKAFKIINKAEQSEKTLRDKLSDYDEDIIDIVIEYLKDCKFINDKDFAILAGSQELTFAASSTVAVDSLNSLIFLSKPYFSKCFLTASIDIFIPPKLL